MANTHKFKVKNGVTTPNIEFKDSNAGSAITATMVDSTDTLSFEGNAGQLFSITDGLTGTLFSVNDISGIPSLEIDDQGIVKLAEFNGKVLISTTDSGLTASDVLNVGGNVRATAYYGDGSNLTGVSTGGGGGGAVNGLYLRYNQVVDSNYVIDSDGQGRGVVAFTGVSDSSGLTISSGVTVTVNNKSAWVLSGGDKNMGLDEMLGSNPQTERTMRSGTIKPTLDSDFSIGASNLVYDVGYFNRLSLKPMTTTTRNALPSVDNGDIIYNSTDNKFQGRANGSWVNLH